MQAAFSAQVYDWAEVRLMLEKRNKENTETCKTKILFFIVKVLNWVRTKNKIGIKNKSL